MIDHHRPLRTITDHYGPLRTITDHYGPLRTITDHYGPLRTITDHGLKFIEIILTMSILSYLIHRASNTLDVF
jgi:hypothetical protein